MEKSKLGISVALLGAAVCLTACFGGYVALALLVGYVLLREDNAWLKRVSVKAAAVTLAFGLCITILGFIPSFESDLSSFVYLFDGHVSFGKLSSIISLLSSILDLIRDIILVIMAIVAIKGKELGVAVIDGIVDKHLN